MATLTSYSFLRKLTFITLISIYLVVFAGGFVRATGSGMGCPDWPKCFGYIIPPVEEAQITWQEGTTYDRGVMIVKDEALWKAKETFTTAQQFDTSHWEKYTKHEYAIFNPYHTWVEYINRLLGALAGLFCFALMSLTVIGKTRAKEKILSVLIVVAMGLQGWMGAKVVESVLAPVQITLHMLLALVIIGMCTQLMVFLEGGSIEWKAPKKYHSLWLIMLSILGLQTILGTQVRQQTDSFEHAGVARLDWFDSFDIQIYGHIVLAYALLGLALYLGYKKVFSFSKNIENIWLYGVVLLAASYLIGMVFRFYDFPMWSTPIHLMSTTLFFGVQIYLYQKLQFKTL